MGAARLPLQFAADRSQMAEARGDRVYFDLFPAAAAVVVIVVVQCLTLVAAAVGGGTKTFRGATGRKAAAFEAVAAALHHQIGPNHAQ